jgi:hypothetical protein
MKKQMTFIVTLLFSQFSCGIGWPIGPFDLGAKLADVSAFLKITPDDAGCRIITVNANSNEAKLLFLDTDIELVFQPSKKGWVLAEIGYVVKNKEILEASIIRAWGKPIRDSQGSLEWRMTDRKISLTETSDWILAYSLNKISCPKPGSHND